jgi:hypothetical protein
MADDLIAGIAALDGKVQNLRGTIVPKPLVVPKLEKLGAVKVPPRIANVAPELLATVPSAVRLPPKVKLPLLLTVVVTVKVF